MGLFPTAGKSTFTGALLSTSSCNEKIVLQAPMLLTNRRMTKGA